MQEKEIKEKCECEVPLPSASFMFAYICICQVRTCNRMSLRTENDLAVQILFAVPDTAKTLERSLKKA